MKIYIYLFVFFVSCTTTVFSQKPLKDTLTEYYNKYPQQALLDAHQIQDEALRTRNKPLLVKSLILYSTYLNKIDSDSCPQIFSKLETFISQEPDITVKSILHSYIAELYLKYYRNHLYVIEGRTPVADYLPENINEWTGNIFKETIYNHLSASIAVPQPLQTTLTSTYNPILLPGADSRLLRPTLYDFLCQRNISLLSELNPMNTDNQTPNLTPQQLTGDLESFLSLTIPSAPDDKLNILKTFQELLAFRQKDGNPEALLIADLERLNYARQAFSSPSTDSSYLATLQKLEKQYAQTPFSVEIIHDKLYVLSDQANQAKPQDQNALKTEIVALAEKTIEKYPDYYRINLLREIIADLKRSTLNVEFPSTVYPGTEAEVKIRFTNTPQLTIQLFRLSADNSRIIENNTISTLSYEQSFSLPASYAPQDTVLKIPLKNAGAYKLIINNGNGDDDKMLNVSGEIMCTSLAIDALSMKKQHTWIVRDWLSGKSVKDAKILIFDNRKLIDSVYTNVHGMATALKGSQYMVVNEVNPEGYLCYLDPYYPRNKNQENTDILTDRKIYRPGQTVYFKGIAWKQSPDQMQVLSGKTMKVSFLNSNNQEITSQQVTTNSFGSFSGSFVIPAQTLNGRFRITTPYGDTWISVSEYKRPEFEISFNESPKRYKAGELIHVKGNIKSFSGVPLVNTPINYRINKMIPYRWRASSDDIFQQGSLQTDAQGEFDLDFQTSSDDPMCYYSIELTATDSKGETQTATFSIPVISHRRQSPILVDMPEYINKEKRNVFYISPENVSDSLLYQINYTISSLVPPTGIKPYPQITDTLVNKTIIEGTLSFIGKDSIIPCLTKCKSGAYLLCINSGEQQTKRIFYLYSPADKRPPVPTYNWLIRENVQFSPEEDAEILFGTSAKKCHILYEIYTADSLIKREYPVLSNEVRRFRIPYKPEYGNNIWVNISYWKDKHYIQEVISIAKKQEPHDLVIEAKTFRDKLQPGQDETWEFFIRKADGKGVVSEVLALMYDASLDKITPNDIRFSPSDQLTYSQPFNLRLNYQIYDLNREYYNVLPYFLLKKNNTTPAFRFDRLNTYSDLAPLYRKSHLTGAVANWNSVTSKEFGEFASSADMQEPVDFRENFQETAFFYPQLQTDSSGFLKFSFKIPESTTKWKFMALAHTPDLYTGMLTKYATTSKELIVRPNMPRFLRSGDTTELKVTVSNLSGKPQDGKAMLELFMPVTGQIVLRQEVPFTTRAGESTTVSFTFSVPQNTDLTGCRISAVTANYSDGEQHLIPVLPDNILVTETHPIYTSTQGTHTFRLANQSTTRKDFRLILEMAANPIWYAVMALPPLSEPKHENVAEIAAAYYVNTIASMIARTNPKVSMAIRQWATTGNDETLLSKLDRNSELKSILLEATPWMLQAQNETEQIQALSRLFDQNRLEYLQEQMLDKLADLQNETGGWSWFPKMSPSSFMTENVLIIMAKASTSGDKEYGEKEKMMQIKGLRYLDNEIKEAFKHNSDRIYSSHLLYLYVRSLYRDIPLGDVLTAHKTYLNLVEKQWGKFSVYDKALAVLTLDNYGRREEALKILASLKQYAITKPDKGMFWPNNRSQDISEILVHTTIMEAFEQIENNSRDMDLMKQWLLLQKQTQQWPGVPATINAIHALLLTGSDQLNQQEQLTIALGNKIIKTNNTGNLPGYLKRSYPASEITPDMQTVKITKTDNQASWGGLYLQYFENLDRIKKTTGPISIKKELFIEETSTGTRTLVPVNKQRVLKTGDKVIVRLAITTDRNMQFVHVQDLRAACFEPVNQISGTKWNAATVYYEEVKDAATNLFFDNLSKGTHIIEYPVWINQSGTYQDGIATLQCIYAPEFSARSNSVKVKIKD